VGFELHCLQRPENPSCQGICMTETTSLLAVPSLEINRAFLPGPEILVPDLPAWIHRLNRFNEFWRRYLAADSDPGRVRGGVLWAGRLEQPAGASV